MAELNVLCDYLGELCFDLGEQEISEVKTLTVLIKIQGGPWEFDDCKT